MAIFETVTDDAQTRITALYESLRNTALDANYSTAEQFEFHLADAVVEAACALSLGEASTLFSLSDVDPDMLPAMEQEASASLLEAYEALYGSPHDYR